MTSPTPPALVRWDVVIATVAVAVGVALRLAPHPSSLWLDELYTVYAADPAVPLARVFWERTVPDFQPPLYYPLMWVWHQLAGTGAAATRLFGGLAGVAALGACAALLRGVLPRTAASAAVAVLALAWAGVFYAHEARAYALLYALAAVGHGLLIRAAAGRRERWNTPALLGVAVLAGGVHYYGMVLGCALFAARAAGFVALGVRRAAAADVVRAAALAAVFAAVLAWQAPFLVQDTVAWLRNDWGRIAHLYWELLAPNDLAAGAMIVLGAVALTGRLAAPVQAALLTGVALGVAGPVLISLHTPVVAARYLIITVPPLLMWATLRAARPKPAWRAGVLALVIVALAGADVRAWPRFRKEDWRAGAELARVHHRPGCPLPVWDWWPGVYAHYLPARLRADLVPVPRHGPVPSPVPGCRVWLWAGHIAGSGGFELVPPPGARVVRLYGQELWLAPPREALIDSALPVRGRMPRHESMTHVIDSWSPSRACTAMGELKNSRDGVFQFP